MPAEPTSPLVLVVEDDPDLRRVVCLQLTASGFAVAEAGDGEAGFARLQDCRPACVITDLMMPALDGFGLLKRIRTIDALSDLPVLVLTASADDRCRLRSFQYRADAYLGKPFDLAELTATVCRLCADSQPVA
ncbi:MAG: response regulator [Candidatus Krumholzibacteriia bacterium]